MKLFLIFALSLAPIYACDCNMGNESINLDSQFYSIELLQDARSKFAQGKHAMGVETMQKAIDTFFPEARNLVLELAQMQAKAGDKESALKNAEAVIGKSESSEELDQIYANALWFRARLLMKSDFDECVKSYKKWQQYDRFQIKSINNDDGTWTQIFPKNCLDGELKRWIIEDFVTTGFCESPDDINFEGDSVTVMPAHVKKKPVAIQKAIDWRRDGCDSTGIVMAMCCNEVPNLKARFTCLVAANKFLQKCYACCDMGFVECVSRIGGTWPQQSHWLDNGF